EDGIRDFHVTGVQTCALPILNLGANNIIYAFDSLYSVNHPHYEKDQSYVVNLNGWAYELEVVSDHEHLVVDDPASIKHHRALNRSEERRVGKEGSRRWPAWHR